MADIFSLLNEIVIKADSKGNGLIISDLFDSFEAVVSNKGFSDEILERLCNILVEVSKKEGCDWKEKLFQMQYEINQSVDIESTKLADKFLRNSLLKRNSFILHNWRYRVSYLKKLSELSIKYDNRCLVSQSWEIWRSKHANVVSMQAISRRVHKRSILIKCFNALLALYYKKLMYLQQCQRLLTQRRILRKWHGMLENAFSNPRAIFLLKLWNRNYRHQQLLASSGESIHRLTTLKNYFRQWYLNTCGNYGYRASNIISAWKVFFRWRNRFVEAQTPVPFGSLVGIPMEVAFISKTQSDNLATAKYIEFIKQMLFQRWINHSLFLYKYHDASVEAHDQLVLRRMFSCWKSRHTRMIEFEIVSDEISATKTRELGLKFLDKWRIRWMMIENHCQRAEQYRSLRIQSNVMSDLVQKFDTFVLLESSLELFSKRHLLNKLSHFFHEWQYQFWDRLAKSNYEITLKSAMWKIFLEASDWLYELDSAGRSYETHLLKKKFRLLFKKWLHSPRIRTTHLLATEAVVLQQRKRKIFDVLLRKTHAVSNDDSFSSSEFSKTQSMILTPSRWRTPRKLLDNI